MALAGIRFFLWPSHMSTPTCGQRWVGCYDYHLSRTLEKGVPWGGVGNKGGQAIPTEMFLVPGTMPDLPSPQLPGCLQLCGEGKTRIMQVCSDRLSVWGSVWRCVPVSALCYLTAL